MTRILAPVVVALALVACGGDDDDDGGDAAVTSATEAPATEAPATTQADAATTAAATAAAATSAPAGSAPAGSAPTATPAVSATSAGYVYSSADGSYEITYPDPPKSQTQQQPLPDGTTLPVTFTISASGSEAFISSVVEYPPGVVADLDGAVQGALTNTGATLKSSDEIELDGRPGRQLVADVAGQGTLIARLYAQDNRLWQVIYTGRGTFGPDHPPAAAFLDSFRFTEE
jgi:hypothetical protein